MDDIQPEVHRDAASFIDSKPVSEVNTIAKRFGGDERLPRNCRVSTTLPPSTLWSLLLILLSSFVRHLLPVDTISS